MFHSVYLLLFGMGFAQDITQVPVTYYLGDLAEASLDTSKALYYHVKLCKDGVAQKQLATLQLYSSDNPTFNTTLQPYMVAQVSVCNNQFDASCVIATNYKWGVQVEAVPNISWPVGDNETDYYIRVMGQNKPSEFAMELSFTDEKTTGAYPWTSILPFNTNGQSGNDVLEMQQYWKYETLQNIANDNIKVFALGYCPETENTIKEIDVSLSTMPNITDYSLIQQWACPQSIDVNSCTPSYAQSNGWYNYKIASFLLLRCYNQGSLTTNGGIWLKVAGRGANLDASNYFYLYATTS